MSDLILNIANWWNRLSCQERAEWLVAHQLKPTWALFTWRCLKQKEQARIESELWRSKPAQAA